MDAFNEYITQSDAHWPEPYSTMTSIVSEQCSLNTIGRAGSLTC